MEITQADADKLLLRVAALEPNLLFTLNRPKNSNTVVFCHKDGKVVSEWIEFMEDPTGNFRSKLTKLEKMIAYSITPLTDTTFSLVSVPGRVFTLTSRNGKAVVDITSNGRKIQVRRVFVNRKERPMMLAEVFSVDVHGVDINTGEPITIQLKK